jgi:hypothetical protein
MTAARVLDANHARRLGDLHVQTRTPRKGVLPYVRSRDIEGWPRWLEVTGTMHRFASDLLRDQHAVQADRSRHHDLYSVSISSPRCYTLSAKRPSW